MRFMVSWNVLPGCHKAASEAFLESGAPFPDGLDALGRWHVPGIARGWLLVETDDLVALGEHLGTWRNLLAIEVDPVLEDEDAGAAMARVYGK